MHKAHAPKVRPHTLNSLAADANYVRVPTVCCQQYPNIASQVH